MLNVNIADDGVSLSDKNLKEVSLYCAVAGNSSLTTTSKLYCAFNNEHVSWTDGVLFSLLGSTERRLKMYVKAIGNGVSARYNSHGIKGFVDNVATAEANIETNKITSIRFYAGTETDIIPAGTTIRLWGRK